MPTYYVRWTRCHTPLPKSSLWLSFFLVISYTVRYNQDLTSRVNVPIASCAGFEIDVANKGIVSGVVSYPCEMPGFAVEVLGSANSHFYMQKGNRIEVIKRYS